MRSIISEMVINCYYNTEPHRIGCAFHHQIAKSMIDLSNYQKGIQFVTGYENQSSFIYDGPNDLVSNY